MKRVRRHRPAWLITVLFLAATAIPAASATDRSATGALQSLLDELQQLTRRSARERAADRWLQRSLEDLVTRYDNPWRRELLFEDFSDGDYQNSPHWQVTAGQFRVDRRLGLRSRIDTVATHKPRRETTQQDLGSALLGAILQQALNDGKPDRAEDSTAAPAGNLPGQPGQIRLQTRIGNAFAIEARFSLPGVPGQRSEFDLGVTQSPRDAFGYRIAITTGQRPVLELQRLRNGRGLVIDSVDLAGGAGRPSLDDGLNHRLRWQQTRDGQISVQLDDRTLISVRDKAYRDDYRWLVLNHYAGDLALADIRILGTE